MSISVIDNDREQLDAKHISGQLRMTSNSPAIRVRKNTDGLTPVERIGPDALATNRATRKTHVDPRRVTEMSAEIRNDLRASTDWPRIEIVLDPVHFCSHETKPQATALKLIHVFAHAFEDPRETANDG